MRSLKMLAALLSASVMMGITAANVSADTPDAPQGVRRTPTGEIMPYYTEMTAADMPNLANPVQGDEEPVGMPVSEAYFPDPQFRRYLLYMLRNSGYGNGDDYISDEEFAGWTYMDPFDFGITSLKGIEYFTSLKELYCYGNKLTTLDLRYNTQLKVLYAGYDGYNDEGVYITGGNMLTTLDMSANPLLETLMCGQNRLVSLDVSSNYLLRTLYCPDNDLTEINVRNNSELRSLNADNNALTTVTLRYCPDLERLSLNGNKFANIDLRYNTKLRYVSVAENLLTDLNVSANTLLNELCCRGNSINYLDVRNNTALTSLDCGSNSITSLDLSNNTALTSIDCRKNNILGFTMTYNQNVPCTVYCSMNRSFNTINSWKTSSSARAVSINPIGPRSGATDLLNMRDYFNEYDFDISRVTNVTGADYESSTGTFLNFTLPYVSFCYIDDNSDMHTFCFEVTNRSDLRFTIPLTDSAFPDSKLRAYAAQFDTNRNGQLEAQEAKELIRFAPAGCGMVNPAGINLNPYITELDVSGNNLSELKNIADMTRLISLDLSENALTYTDLSKLKYLERLNVSDNRLGSLDVSRNTMLTSLSVKNNSLTSVDLSRNVILRELDVSNNMLVALDLSDTQVTRLVCNDNCMYLGDVSDFFDLTLLERYGFDPSKASGWRGAVYNADICALTSFTDRTVTYNYDCGNGLSAKFTLKLGSPGDLLIDETKAAAFVDRLYTKLLRRAADPQGKRDHMDCLRRGRSAAEVAASVLHSTEFIGLKLTNQEYVDRMYLTFLNRPAYNDPASRTWVTMLNNGCSRDYIFRGFVESIEFSELCSEQYRVVRGSVPTVQNRDRNYNVTCFVSRLYKNALDEPEPDESGLNSWTGIILNEGRSSLSSVAHGFIFSPQFTLKYTSNEAYVIQLYRALFGREPQKGEETGWVNAMYRGISREQVFRGFLGSVECTAYFDSFGLS